jgi:hypothetical protein
VRPDPGRGLASASFVCCGRGNKSPVITPRRAGGPRACPWNGSRPVFCFYRSADETEASIVGPEPSGLMYIFIYRNIHAVSVHVRPLCPSMSGPLSDPSWSKALPYPITTSGHFIYHYIYISIYQYIYIYIYDRPADL